MRYTLALIVAAALCPAVVVAQVNLPEGFEIVQFAVSDYLTGVPRINECGQIVFDKRLGPDSSSTEIFLYDNGELARITENAVRDRSGEINDAGEIVWKRATGGPPDKQVIHYHDGVETVFDACRHGVRRGSINNLGHIAWTRDRKDDCKTDVFFWDGETVVQISERKWFIDQDPRLNDLDWIVWSRLDFCVVPWFADIMLYSDGPVSQLNRTTGQYVDQAINNRGQVAWMFEEEIYLWEDGRIRKVITGLSCGGPRINEMGDIYFWRWHDDINRAQAWMCQFSDGQPRFYRLVEDENASHAVGDINDWGEATWRWMKSGTPWPGGVCFLRRIRSGDADFDGKIDLSDYPVFADCMTGPGRVDRLCDCRFLDIDHDGDVDLGDFALFQNAFEGK